MIDFPISSMHLILKTKRSGTMKKSIYLIIFLISAVLLSACKKESQYKPAELMKEDKIGIIIEKDSALRTQPYIYSTKIQELRRGDKVIILEQSAETSFIAGKKNYWFKILLDNGITGWIYGANIKLFEENASSSIESYEKDLKTEEIENTKKLLIGKWWSINKRGDFTAHLLKIYPDGKYLSLKKQGKEMTGEFTLDAIEQTMTFSNSTSVGNVISFIDRGGELFLEYKDSNNVTYSFKKISMEPDSDEEKILTVEE